MPPEWQGCRQQQRRSMWGLPGVGEQQRVLGLGGPCPGHSREGTRGSGTGGQKGQRFAAARKSSKSQCAFIVYSALALSFFTQKKQACKYHNNKAGIEFLFWKTMNISFGFGSYRMKLFFLQEGAEIIS